MFLSHQDIKSVLQLLKECSIFLNLKISKKNKKNISSTIFHNIAFS